MSNLFPDETGGGNGGEESEAASWNWLTFTVSMYAAARITECRDVAVSDVLRGIKSGRWRESVGRVQKAYARAYKTAVKVANPDPYRLGKDAADALKKRLPGVTPSGRFAKRASTKILTHSGILCVDVDDLDDPAALREKLKSDRHVLAAFVSPTGSGLKVWLRILPDASLHHTSFLAAQRHLKEVHGVDIDEGCKDVARLCFVSDDPNIFIRANGAQILEPAKAELQSEAPRQQEPQDEAAMMAIPERLILLPGGPIGNLRSAETVFNAIAQRNSYAIFVRNGSVIKIHTTSKDDRVDPQEEGALRIEDLTADEFRSEIEKYGTIFAYRTGPHGELLLKAGARMSRDVATMLLTSEPRFRLPKLAIVHACPLLIQEAKGTMRVLGRGYHTFGGGRYVTRGKTVPQVSLPNSVGYLLSMLEEFDFVTSADKSRAMAAVLSPALRMGGLLNCYLPIFAFEADKTQSGKGYLLELIHRIYNEIPYMLFNRKGGVGGFDEDLSQALVKGHPFIQIDNIRSAIDSQFLEMMMTCELNGQVSARTPYRPGTCINPHRFILQLTSNSYDTTDDLSARSSIVRIRKKEGYAFRKYPEGDLLAHVGANQLRYLGAVFAVAARWVREGKPRTDDLRGEGRFRAWAQSLDWIIQNICAACAPGWPSGGSKANGKSRAFVAARCGYPREATKCSWAGTPRIQARRDVGRRGVEHPRRPR
jgi:hypothetical protein